MKIGFDAKRLFTNFTGLGNYSRSLVSDYHRFIPDDDLILFTPRIEDDPRTKPFFQDPKLEIVRPSGFSPFWRTLDVVKDIKATTVSVYHGLSHELPVGISKLDIGKVVTIHDLIFKYYPDDYPWLDRKIYDLKWRHACSLADVIIAISNQTKADLIKYYHVPSEKITVIYQPADAIFSKPVNKEATDTVRKEYHLPAEYFLYVGSLISRKNLLSIVRAMALLKKNDQLPLVIIGNGPLYKKKVIAEAKQLKVDHLLIWLGSPPFHDFPALYRNASMMIYPSRHEGFGLPVVEAMHTGLPVITSDQSSLREAGGQAAYLIDPEDPEAIAGAMSEILNDDHLRESMIRKGFDHIRKFDARLSCEELRRIYSALS